MKITKFLVLAIMMVLITSCHDDVANPYNDDNIRWKDFIGKHFTCESKDFHWADFPRYGVSLYPIMYGEFVEFYNLTDSYITMKYGNEHRTYFNLADITDNKIKQLVACPYTIFSINPSVEISLHFKDDPVKFCYFEGNYIDEWGYFITLDGRAYSAIQITKSVGYVSPIPSLRKPIMTESPHIMMDWRSSLYQFDKSSLKCVTSPLIVSWYTTEWSGNLATLMPNASDFLQLMLSMPILRPQEYELHSKVPNERVSILDVIRETFPHIIQHEYAVKDHNDFPTGGYELGSINYGFRFADNTIIVSKINEQRLCCRIDANRFFDQIKHPAYRCFMANILRSLLSEDRCHFEMQYELIDCDINDQSKKREFHMTLSDPQHSRNIMEYLIIPLLIENKQTIKDYIRQDAELSQHADVLCAAVDRLEEIYAGTTDLTLGYRLIEHQWD